jgi:hypothetical protein
MVSKYFLYPDLVNDLFQAKQLTIMFHKFNQFFVIILLINDHCTMKPFRNNNLNIQFRIWCFTLCCFLAFRTNTSAQGYSTITYTNENGLGGSNFFDIIQDSKGRLWVGSFANGVNCFDGESWKNYTKFEGLLNDRVINFFEDRDGAIWFHHPLTGGSAASRLLSNGQIIHYSQFNHGIPKGVLMYDRYKQKPIVMGGAPDWLIYEFNYASDTFEKTGRKLLPEDITRKYEIIYLSNDYYRDRYILKGIDTTTKTADCFIWNKGKITPLLQNNTVLDLYKAGIDCGQFLSGGATNIGVEGHCMGADSLVITASAQGIFVYRSGMWKKLPPPRLTQPVYGFEQPLRLGKLVNISYDYSQGGIIAIWDLKETNQYLLAEYEPTTMKLIRSLQFASPYSPMFAMKDKAGTYWVSTESNVTRILPYQYFIPADIPGYPKKANALIQAGDRGIWLASYGYGLARFNGIFIEKPLFPGLHTSRFLGGSTMYQGRMVFSMEPITDSGRDLMVFDGLHKSFLTNLWTTTYYLSTNKQGDLLRGTVEKGLWILPAGKSIESDSSVWIKINHRKGLQLEKVKNVVQDDFKRYWMSDDKGLALYDPAQDTVWNWLQEDNKLEFLVMSMDIDQRGNLWLGTERGLYFLENRRTIDGKFQIKKHLLSVGNDIIGISPITVCKQYDANTLILGNSFGYYLLDINSYCRDTQKAIIRPFQKRTGNYTGSDVAQNLVCMDSDRNIWLLTSNGAVRHEPAAYIADTIPPGISIDSISAGQRTLSGRSLVDIVLNNTERSPTIYFHTNKGPFLYNNTVIRYRISNETKRSDQADTWKILSNSDSITFQYLSPGKYVFEMQALKEGMESKIAKIRFCINPPDWQRWWFWMIIFITGVLTATYVFVKQQKINQQKIHIEKDKTLLEKVSKEKNKLQVQVIASQLNPHFIKNAVQWLQMRMQQDKEAVKVVGKLSENIKTVFVNSRENKPFHALKMELLMVDNYLFIQQCRFRDKLSYELPEPDSLKAIEEINIPMLMIQIHVENAVEHGIRNQNNGVGKVMVQIREDDDYIVVTIIDDGVGRAAAKLIGSQGTESGTKMLKELEKIYNQQNKWKISQHYEDDIFVNDQGIKHGTRAIVRIPKQYNYQL